MITPADKLRAIRPSLSIYVEELVYKGVVLMMLLNIAPNIDNLLKFIQKYGVSATDANRVLSAVNMQHLERQAKSYINTLKTNNATKIFDRELGKDNYRVYYINLANRKDRMRTFRLEMGFIGLKHYARFNAIDSKTAERLQAKLGNVYDFDAIKTSRHFQGFNLMGLIGCFLSHMHVIKRFLKSDAEYCIIFEDDAFFHQRYNAMLNDVLPKAKQYDLFYFGHRITAKTYDKIQQVDEHIQESHGATIYYLHAYMVRREFARYLYQSYKPIKAAVDHVVPVMAYESNRFRVGLAKDKMVFQNWHIASNIIP